MKKIIVVLLFISLFSACEITSPIEDNPFTGSFVFSGTTYSIVSGNIEDYQNVGSPYNLGIYLMGQGMGFDTVNSVFTGLGDIVVLDLNSSTAGDFTNGTYSWWDGTTVGTFEAEAADFYIDYNTGDDSFSDFAIGAGGSVTISKSGSIYTISFTILDGSGATIVTGSGQGELPIWTD